MNLLPLTVLLTLLVQLTQGYDIVGYDCLHDSSNVTSISSYRVLECPIRKERVKTSLQEILVVSKKVITAIPGYQCSLVKHSLITGCGMFSHAIIQQGGLSINEDVALTKEECETAVYRGIYITATGMKVDRVSVNRRMRFSEVDIGSVDSNGKCTGATITSSGRLYENVIRTSNYDLLVKKLELKLDMDTNTIHTHDGLAGKYSLGVMPGDSSVIIWSIDDSYSKCGEKYFSLMHRGYANVSDTSTGNDIVTVDREDYSFAIVIKSPKFICNIPFHITDYDGVYVVLNKEHISSALELTDKSAPEIKTDLILDLKLFYIEQNSRNRTTDLYNTVMAELCKSMLMNLNNLLTLARTNPEEFAWQYTNSPGYTAVSRGEVIYLVKCTPVVVTIRDSDSCFNEIPVSYKNSSVFLKPATRIITPYGIPIPCTPLMPQLFYIGGKWTKITGEPYAPMSPQVLSPNPDKVWEYGALISEKTIGYVPKDALTEYKRALLLPSEREAVGQIFASNVITHDSAYQGLRFGDALIDEEYLDSMTNKIRAKIYGVYDYVVRNLGAVFGFMLIWDFIARILSAISNVVMLYSHYGLSIYLLLAFWSTLTKHTLYGDLRTRFQQARRRLRRRPVNDHMNRDAELGELQETREPMIITSPPGPNNDSSSRNNNISEYIPPLYPRLNV